MRSETTSSLEPKFKPIIYEPDHHHLAISETTHFKTCFPLSFMPFNRPLEIFNFERPCILMESFLI